MANLIIENSPTIQWYSDLFPFFSLIESTIRSHYWLWTDVDVTSELPVPPNDHDRYLIDGDVLFDFTLKRPQFVWSVLSALPADTNCDPAALESAPYADGNSELWRGSPRPQLPDAHFEIVCWDSSATLLIGASGNVADAFLMAYPDARYLDVDNQSRG
ncbi:hypothetical protein [Allorhodopirellula heiligendammensis]|uniref:Uncharacterized protein n=1 Tax=Allorhodopirellula heiligendammensis TaxID=2714739 RepID=A0A5C6C338_9BACT|nr:hypothetical protein [Allorhodopirellula heiligendammensis]TWU18495.1 hypothetical protein Poly21_06580 [Allorhodopirellula heiligendammensis]